MTPPGDIGNISQFILDYSLYPEPDLALAGAISIYAGIVGRAYNTPTGAGLNIYTLYLAPTGAGKNIVKQARSRLFFEVAKQVPCIEDTKGPGELASPQGLLRWLEKRPCCLSIFGEFAPMLKRMTDARANANDAGTGRAALEAYSSSGAGSTIDPIAYSDTQKNTATINAPAYSIFAESIPETIYEAADDRLIVSGMLPRFDVWENNKPRSYINRNRIPDPSQALVDRVAEVAKHCLEVTMKGNVILPTYDVGAESRLYEFEAWTTDQINASTETGRQLWNRAYLKALKFASLYAVSECYFNPVISLEAVNWATNLVAKQTNALVAKLASGETGRQGGNQTRQEREVLRVLADYHSKPFNVKYNGTEEMHRVGVITQSHISQRLSGVVAFKDDPRGALEALQRTLKSLLEADIIREVPRAQMGAQFNGKHPRAFVVSDPAAVLKAAGK